MENKQEGVMMKGIKRFLLLLWIRDILGVTLQVILIRGL